MRRLACSVFPVPRQPIFFVSILASSSQISNRLEELGLPKSGSPSYPSCLQSTFRLRISERRGSGFLKTPDSQPLEAPLRVGRAQPRVYRISCFRTCHIGAKDHHSHRHSFPRVFSEARLSPELEHIVSVPLGFGHSSNQEK